MDWIFWPCHLGELTWFCPRNLSKAGELSEMLRESDVRSAVSVRDRETLSAIERGSLVMEEPGESCRDNPSSMDVSRGSDRAENNVVMVATNFFSLSTTLLVRTAEGSAEGSGVVVPPCLEAVRSKMNCFVCPSNSSRVSITRN